MSPTRTTDLTIALVPDSMVALHPLDRLTQALGDLEAGLRLATSGGLGLQTVLRFIEAGELALGSPIAERDRLRQTILTWAFEEGEFLPQWGLAVRSGTLVVTDPVQLGMQLGAYPWLSRIVLKRLTEVWRQALATVRAW